MGIIKLLVIYIMGALPFYYEGRMTPELKKEIASLSKNEKIYVVVHLSQRYPYQGIKHLSVQERANLFKQIAEESQDRVFSLLSRVFKEGKDYEIVYRFWVYNGFHLRATPEVIEFLSKLEDIWFMDKNREIRLHYQLSPDEIKSSINAIEWNILKVRADSCWLEGYDGTGVIIGHIDTGVDVNHPALQGKWLGQPYWFDGVNGQSEPYDDHGHGTHTMGTILGGDGFGSFSEDIGVAPGAQFVTCKAFNSSGSGSYEWIDPCMQKIADWKSQGINIVACGNSWGSSDGTNTHWWDIVLTWKSLNILPVFSNGNSGSGSGTVGTPAAYPTTLGVGATDNNDYIASFSSRGPSPNISPYNDPQYWYYPDWNFIKPDVSAPGVDVRSSLPGGGYGLMSGTSMASPHVTGAAAILCQKNPNLTPQQLFELLTFNARQPSHGAPYPNNDYGWGILNVYESLKQTPSSDEPYVVITSTPFSDANNSGIWDPGEQIELYIKIKNTGGGEVDSVRGVLRFNDPYVTILSDSVYYHGYMSPGDTSVAGPFILNSSPTTPSGHDVQFTYHITGSQGYTADRIFSKSVGIKAGTPIIEQPAPNVPTDGLVYGIAYDGDTLVYITEYYGNVIYVTKSTAPDAELIILTTIPAPEDSCSGITYDPAGYLWVHEIPGNMLYKIDPSDGTIIQSFPSPASQYPTGLAYDPNTGYIWVVDRDANTIYEFDPQTGNTVGSIPVPYTTDYGPRGLAFEPNGPNGGSLLHLATFWSGTSYDSTVVMELNRNTGEVVNGHTMKIPGLHNGRAVEFDPRPYNGYYTYWISETNYTSNLDTIFKVYGFYAQTVDKRENITKPDYRFNMSILYSKGIPFLKILSPDKKIMKLKIFDPSGRILQKQKILLKQGANILPITVGKRGIHFIVLERNKEKHTIKFLKLE